MSKTINLPQQLSQNKKKLTKVIVIEEYEERTEKGQLKVGIYKFKWENNYYKIVYQYKNHKVIKSELYKIISPA